MAAGQRARRKSSGKKKLPPNMLPGIAKRRKQNSAMIQRFVAVGIFVFVGLFLTTMLATAVSTIAAVGGTVEAYRRVNDGLPNAAEVTVDTFQTSRIYDRNGKLLQEIEAPDGGWRTFVSLDQVSQVMIDATVAAEDATFWSHQGVEPMAILRGVTINLSGEGSSGGSTITQQLARGLYPEEIGFDISVTRKFKEALAAVELDRKFSKQDIMTMYLNQIFYGQRSYGIEAAAQTYFNKHASELNLAEASLLAGLPQAPSFYDPTIRMDQAKIRQQYVLDQMVKYHYITREEADAAWNTPLQPQTRTSEVQGAPHFTQYVKDYVIEKYGEDAFTKGGLQIWTSIDLDLQAQAETIVKENMPFLNAYRRNNAAMVVMVPYTGEVLAMVGSADFNDPTIGGQINYALANLQPGSSIKPVIYAAAFESGWNPATVVMDDTMRVETPGAPDPYYEPKNYTGYSYGAVSVRTALSNSLNIPAVKAIQYAGVEHAYDLGRRMGYKTGMPESPENYGLSLALGSGEIPLLEHTNVYATFANGGKYVAANPILKITDSNGQVLYELDRETSLQNAPQALSQEISYQVTSILTDVEARSMVFGRGNLFEDTADRLGQPGRGQIGHDRQLERHLDHGLHHRCSHRRLDRANQPIGQRGGRAAAARRYPGSRTHLATDDGGHAQRSHLCRLSERPQRSTDPRRLERALRARANRGLLRHRSSGNQRQWRHIDGIADPERRPLPPVRPIVGPRDGRADTRDGRSAAERRQVRGRRRIAHPPVRQCGRRLRWRHRLRR